jgi:predicted enzyme related to lactoylglutathione lyase
MANFTVTKYPHGTFSWVDCTSTDAAKAKDFYAAVMGWMMEDSPIGDGTMYTMFFKDGHAVAGLSQNRPEVADMPSVWNNYITVDDVDALAPKVTELGGQVMMPPMDVLDQGRMLMLQDPSGAYVCLWQPKKHIGSGLVNVPGSVTWNELTTRGIPKAEAFFKDLLGWTFADGPMPDYRIFSVNGRMNGGMLEMGPEFGDMPPHWMVYFAVEDIDDVVAKVPTLGGKVRTEVIEAAGVGRFAVVEDPAGAICTMMQVEKPDTWVE